jgi:cysteine synthase
LSQAPGMVLRCWAAVRRTGGLEAVVVGYGTAGEARGTGKGIAGRVGDQNV